MEIIKNLLAQLDSSVSDPVVKFLVISVAGLIIVVIFNIIINMLKSLFRALFCRKKKPKTQKKTAHNSQPEAQSQQLQPNNSEEHLQTAQDVLSIIKKLIASTSLEENEDITIPSLLLSTEEHPVYNADTLIDLEYQVTNEDIEKTIDVAAGKNVVALKGLLKDIQTKIKTAEFTVENDKAKFLKLVEERTSLKMLEEKAIEECNHEILKATKEIETTRETRNEAIQSLKNTESTVSDLIITYLETSAKLKQQRSLLAEQNLETQQIIDNFKTTIDTLRPSSSIVDPLSIFQKQAKKSTEAIKDTDSKISALVGSISATSKELSLNRLAAKTISNQIEKLQVEEARRLAEEKERKEAEAKARAIAIEEARRKEEERLAAEKAEKLRIQEQQRLETQRRLEEQRQKEEMIAKAQAQTVPTPPVMPNTQEFDGDPSSPEAEALQAKAMMEAQRERRRQAALQRANSATVSEPSEKTVSEPPKASEPVEKPITSETLEPEHQDHDKPKTAPVNPMAAIEAEWAREREAKEKFAAYQREREEEIERRKAALEAENRKGNKPSSSNNNT